MQLNTYKKAKEYLNDQGIEIAEQTLRTKVSRGEFDVVRAAGRTYIPTEVLDRWIAEAYVPATHGPLAAQIIGVRTAQ